jgi:hypothetical protein
MMKQIGKGLLAGVAGTAALTAVVQLEERALPWGQKHNALFPHKVVKKAENFFGIQGRLTGNAETAAIQGSNFAYGTLMGGLYGWSAPKLNVSPWVSGPLFGLALWAVGLSGWVPGMGAEQPPWKKKPMQAMMPILSHLAYGLAAAAVIESYQTKQGLLKKKRLFSV